MKQFIEVNVHDSNKQPIASIRHESINMILELNSYSGAQSRITLNTGEYIDVYEKRAAIEKKIEAAIDCVMEVKNGNATS